MPKNMEGKEKQNQQWYQIKVFVAVQSLSHVQLLQPHELQKTRLFCPSLSPRVCSNSCPLNWWCHPTISSSLIPFYLPSIFPSIRVFSNESALGNRWPKWWSFSLGSVLPVNIQSGFPLGLTVLISLLSKGLSRMFSSTTVQKCQFFGIQPSLRSNSDIHTWLLEKP